MALFDLFRRNRPVYVRSVRVGTEAVLGMPVERLYRTQPALRAVVSFLADNMSSVPLKVYDRSSDNDRPRVTDGPLYELLSRPSPTLTPQQLWNGTSYDYLLYDSALWYVYDSVDAASGYEVWRVPWAWVKEERTEDGLNPSEFVIQNPDSMRAPVSIKASDCILFRAYDPMGPLHHASRVDALKQVLAEQISAWKFRNGIWRNGGRVTQYLTRPLNAPDWDKNGGRKRFAKSWKERYSGDEGTNTGGTPLLEDGMELKSTSFNAREAQWQEATKLTREDVAAVYHVNPSIIWHTDGQTYASAKDNARALYSDTLAPTLNMFENVINQHLAARIGAPPTQYAEFDLDVKLAASFEERISAMQSSVGGPWMTRNEARAKMNYPALEGCDELIVPMNVTAGGLASPNDTDPTVERYNAAPVAFVQDGVVYAMPTKGESANPPRPRAAEAVRDEAKTVTLKSVAEAPKSAVSDIEECLTRFLERQCTSVVNSIAAGESKSRRKGVGDYPFWWDAVRWNKELADDLEPLFRTVCDLRGASAMADIGEPADAWDSSRTANFVRAMAERRADLFNETTYEELAAALMEFEEGDAGLITAAERAFLDLAQNRAARGAQTFATAVSGFATKEAVNQRYPRDTDKIRRTKTWRHHSSQHPRSTHAAMDGQTVGLDEKFSNGADYPGDLSLQAKEAVNCHCTMEVGVEVRDSPT